jgi:hypothetical protein
MKIMFWKNQQSGNYLTHKNGLTKELVEQLQHLQEGDRLILWVNEKTAETYPDLTLKIFKSKENRYDTKEGN